jgi:hypothetical protein
VLFSSKCHKKLPIATNLQQNNKFSDILKFKNKSELLFNEVEDDKGTKNSAAPVHSGQVRGHIESLEHTSFFYYRQVDSSKLVLQS